MAIFRCIVTPIFCMSNCYRFIFDDESRDMDNALRHAPCDCFDKTSLSYTSQPIGTFLRFTLAIINISEGQVFVDTGMSVRKRKGSPKFGESSASTSTEQLSASGANTPKDIDVKLDVKKKKKACSYEYYAIE